MKIKIQKFPFLIKYYRISEPDLATLKCIFFENNRSVSTTVYYSFFKRILDCQHGVNVTLPDYDSLVHGGNYCEPRKQQEKLT